MESHVCVFQTARELVKRGYATHVVADAVSSRSEENRVLGLSLCERAGAVITGTETVVFDLLGRAGTDAFKAISKLIR
jgi:nicotinamidase-related amidase